MEYSCACDIYNTLVPLIAPVLTFKGVFYVLVNKAVFSAECAHLAVLEKKHDHFSLINQLKCLYGPNPLPRIPWTCLRRDMSSHLEVTYMQLPFKVHRDEDASTNTFSQLSGILKARVKKWSDDSQRLVRYPLPTSIQPLGHLRVL